MLLDQHRQPFAPPGFVGQPRLGFRFFRALQAIHRPDQRGLARALRATNRDELLIGNELRQMQPPQDVVETVLEGLVLFVGVQKGDSASQFPQRAIEIGQQQFRLLHE
ncbi:hypothetical protein [Cupriavidus laharis]|uniref:hypothetical protein n=1 Tax=Cupriavidus laharis TaxID=151654 RepID=UPI001CC7189A|nr:hypothetical protein [Cupriavidus laharis]